ncbi:MAG: efflux RND transporter periplasmic adaptor subunit [Planctomycetota bacterium]
MIPADSAHAAPPHGAKSFAKRLAEAASFIAALAVTLAVMAWLLFAPTPPEPEAPPPRKTLQDSVKILGPRRIAIAPDCPLAASLESIAATTTSLSEPVFTVTGRVVASLRPGNGEGADYWQFDSPEILTVYTDFQKAKADIEFAKNQLVSIKKLAATRIESQQKVVDRLRKLVAVGTDTLKDLAAEETNFLQFEIAGKKEVHGAESALLIAERNKAALSRQLQLAGLDPDLLNSVKSDMDIVVADVPEGRLTEVSVGVGCQARFFGIPDTVFSGKVNRVLPVLSKDRHSLRVLCLIHDEKDQVRPGMFAEIGLKTDRRDTILIPTDAILHVGRSDYVLVQEDTNAWRVTEVKVGELHGDLIEIGKLNGAELDGKRILTKGAILLKPPVVLSLQSSVATPKRE